MSWTGFVWLVQDVPPKGWPIIRWLPRVVLWPRLRIQRAGLFRLVRYAVRDGKLGEECGQHACLFDQRDFAQRTVDRLNTGEVMQSVDGGS